MTPSCSHDSLFSLVNSVTCVRYGGGRIHPWLAKYSPRTIMARVSINGSAFAPSPQPAVHLDEAGRPACGC